MGANSESTVTLRLNGENGQLVATIEVSKKALSGLGQTSQSAGTQAAAGMKAAERGADALTAKLRNIGSTRAGIESVSQQLAQLRQFAGIGALLGVGGASIREVASLADEYTNLTSKIRLVSDSEAAAAATRQRVIDLAQRTRTELAATGELYARLSRATATLNYSEQQRLRITETINKALIVSGASSSEASSAIIQLSQGLSAGALRGEEFNSVAEQAPILLELMTKALGVSRGELRKMADAGQLTASVVTGALLTGAQNIDEQFAKMAPTIGGAVTQLKNAATVLVGTASEATSGSTMIASAISLLAANLRTVAVLIELVAAGLGARLVASLATAVQRMIGAQLAASAIAAEMGIAAASVGLLGRAMALLGGPIGVIVLAVGAAVVALQELTRAESARQQEFNAGLQQMRESAKAATELAKSYREISLVPFKPLPNFDDALQRYADNTAQLTQRQAEYNAKREELRSIEAQIETSGSYWAETGSIQLATMSQRAAQLRAEVGPLGTEIAKLRSGTDDLGNALGNILAPGFASVGREAIDLALKIGSSTTAMQGLQAVATTFGVSVDRIVGAIRGGVQAEITNWNSSNAALGKSITDVEAKFKTFGLTQAQIIQRELDAVRASKLWAMASDEQRAKLTQSATSAIAHANAMDKSKKSTDDGKKAAAEFIAKLQEQVATFGQSRSASDRYEATTKKLTPAQRALAESLIATLDAWERTAKVTKVAYEALDELRKGNAELDSQIAKARDELAGLDDAQVKYNESLREANKLAAEALALGPPTAEVQQLIEDRLRKITELRDADRAVKAHQDATRAMAEAERDALHRSQQMWGDWIDAVFNAARQSGNYLKHLGHELKQVVLQMLADWAKTRLIGAFTGRAGGSGGGLLGGLAGMFFGGGGRADGWQQATTGNLNVTDLAMQFGTGGSGGGFNLFSPGSWLSAGKNLWSGFQNGFSASGVGSSNFFGTYTPDAGVGTFQPSAIGYGTAIAGGVYAGLTRWQGSGKDVGGALGAAAYGYGTYAATIGAGAALSGGAAAGLGAIGPIGWVALAAMVVDKLFGGKLFGTGYRPESAQQGISLGPNGASAWAGLSESRQSAFFGGRKWKWTDLEVPAELTKAAEGLFKAVGRIITDAARKVAIDVPPMIDATLRTVQELDKKGRVKSTKYFVDILGRTWEESSSELAGTRVSAEAIVATVAASEAGKAAGKIAEQWRDNAEALLAGAQFLLDATADITKGRSLLKYGTGPAKGADSPDELSQITGLVQELANGNEQLSETYARLHADADNLQSALDLMGTTLDKSGSDFVRFAAAIEQAAGGVDQANALWQAFTGSFYSQSELALNQLKALQQASTSALASIGLDANTSMEAYRAAFEKNLPTLTPEQVVTWLQAAKALADTTAATQRIVEQGREVLASMGLATGGLTQFGQAIVAIKLKEKQAEDAANAIARAQGREGASAIQLAKIHDWTAKQMAAAVRQLDLQRRDLMARLYGGVPGSLDAINARITELEGAARSAGGGIADGIRDVADAGNDMIEQWRSGAKSLSEYLDSSLFGDLSPLSPEDQVTEARRQLDDALVAAGRGDATALANLPRMMDQFARLLRETGTASGGDFNGVIFDYRRQLAELLRLQGPQANPNPNAGGGSTVTMLPSPELAALYAERDARLAEQETAYRAQLTQQLAENLADTAEIMKVPVLQLIEAQGLNLRTMAEDLGANLEDLTGASVEVLGNMATTLGVPLGELVQRLGLSLPELRDGLAELTAKLGIDLTSLTSTTAGQLVGLAGSLGTNLRDLSTALGIDLGKLTDVNSPIFKALEANIADLSPDIKTELTPLLDAVRLASGDEQKNAAVKALRDHVDKLAPDVRNELGPFFDDIIPARSLSQLDYLDDLQRIAGDQLDVLKAIRSNLQASNAAAGVASYAIGTGFVDYDQLANIHYGEAVVPSAVNAWFRSANWQLPRAAANDGHGSDERVLAVLRAIHARLDTLERSNADGQRLIAGTISGEGEKDRRHREDLASRSSDGFRRSTRYG